MPSSAEPKHDGVPAPVASASAGATPAVHARTTTAPEDRISIPQRIAYGLGGTSFQLGSNLLNQLAQPIYTLTLGVNPIWIGTVQACARLWDAVIDPAVGTWSDNFRSRFGRRRPFIVAGAILTGLFFPLLWWVPRSFSDVAAFIYFLVASLIFYTFFAFYSVTYQTLGLELTPDYHERTRVMVVRTLLNQIATMGMPWVFWLCQWDRFGDTLTGARVVSLGAGLAIVGLGVLPGLLLKERYYKLSKTQPKQRHLDALIEPFKNRPFLIVASIVLLVGAGISTVESLGLYINVYHVAQGNKKFGAALLALNFGTTLGVLSMVSTFGINLLAGRISKLTMLRVCIVLAMVGSLSTWFCYTPAMPYLQLLVPILTAPAISGFWIYTNSMKMDVTDYDEWKCGKRREGIFGAASAWTYKAGASVTYLFTANIIMWIGFDSTPGAVQTEHFVQMMRLSFALVPFLLFAAALYLTRHFEITETLAAQIRLDLETRRERV